ncbi:MAG: hypothetical protein IJX30_03225 [Clostridia bacterium]|nr:hypothetical protein [Clostridia bacterium]
MELYKRELFLQLFADGGAAADGAGTGDGGNAEAGDAAPQVDLDAEFSELTKGKFKDVYNRNVQSIIDRRLKNVAPLKERLAKTDPIIDMLSKKYGEDDVDRLTAAIENDSSFFEQEAAKRGLDVEQFKTVYKAERESEAMRLENERLKAERDAQEAVAKWQQQSEEIKRIYDPAFDFAAECERNESFTDLLKRGVDALVAYKATHTDDLVANAMQVAAQKVAEKTAKAVQSRGQRPAEGGTAGGVVSGKIDVNSLTGQDIRSILDRVAKGEQINL